MSFRYRCIVYPSLNECLDNWTQKKSQSFVFCQRPSKQEIGKRQKRERVEINRETAGVEKLHFSKLPEVSEIVPGVKENVRNFSKISKKTWGNIYLLEVLEICYRISNGYYPYILIPKNIHIKCEQKFPPLPWVWKILTFQQQPLCSFQLSNNLSNSKYVWWNIFNNV